MRVRGSVVVVTGASSGIGRATARLLAGEGARVVVTARRSRALDDLADELRGRGASVLPVPADMADAEQVDDLAAEAVAAYGRIDAWVNVAAVSVLGRLEDIPERDLRRVIDVDVLGYVHGMRAALEHMRGRGGVIVDVASVLGAVTQPYAAPYCMAKHAVRALDATVRQELRLAGERGIAVCTVTPAAIDTPFYDHLANVTGRAVRPLRPLYPPEKVARRIVRLLRHPRRESVVGRAGSVPLALHAVAPRAAERLLALNAEFVHLSRREPAPPTHGNLYATDDADARERGRRARRARTRAARAAVGAAAAAVALAVADRAVRGGAGRAGPHVGCRGG